MKKVFFYLSILLFPTVVQAQEIVPLFEEMPSFNEEKKTAQTKQVQSASVPVGQGVTQRRAGVPNLGNTSRRGNHNFVVKIKTPQSLSQEEKNLYKKLFEINCNKKPSSKFIDKMKNVLHN